MKTRSILSIAIMAMFMAACNQKVNLPDAPVAQKIHDDTRVDNYY